MPILQMSKTEAKRLDNLLGITDLIHDDRRAGSDPPVFP